MYIFRRNTENSRQEVRILKFNLGLQRLADKKFDSAKDKYVNWKQTYSHGLSWWGLMYEPAKIFGALVALKFLSAYIPIWVFWGLVPFWFCFWTFVGHIDRYYLKLWQREAEWGQRKINPFDQEMLRRIKKIEKKVNAK